MAAIRYLAFFKSRLNNYGYGSEGQCASSCKFCGNRSSVVKIWQFFELWKWHLSTFWILQIQNFIGNRVKRVKMYYCTKFHGNLLNHCWLMAIWRFFKRAAICHHGFLITGIFDKGYSSAQRFNMQLCITVQDFVAIDQTILRYGDLSRFSKWRPSAMLDLLWARLEHPWRVFGGTYHCAKICWNRYFSFDNTQVLVFFKTSLAWKCLPVFMPSKWRFLGDYTP